MSCATCQSGAQYLEDPSHHRAFEEHAGLLGMQGSKVCLDDTIANLAGRMLLAADHLTEDDWPF
ncbi:hypothetical protein D3H34_06945 [Acidovorax cavernicola]|uniref:Uncharacterized protein n=1 Tax=Acidovorax cavernicola TaxID=1675792 RepID=A0A9X8D866_9BURK|nr:hypothetical protein D3H34_06945 [Acidovorax cavernicola]